MQQIRTYREKFRVERPQDSRICDFIQGAFNVDWVQLPKRMACRCLEAVRLFVGSLNNSRYPFPSSYTLKTERTRGTRPAKVATRAILAALVLLVGAIGFLRAAEPALTSFSEAKAFDISFVSIPEPGALVSLVGGAALLIGIQRFRRRS